MIKKKKKSRHPLLDQAELLKFQCSTLVSPVASVNVEHDYDREKTRIGTSTGSRSFSIPRNSRPSFILSLIIGGARLRCTRTTKDAGRNRRGEDERSLRGYRGLFFRGEVFPSHFSRRCSPTEGPRCPG